MLFQTIAIGRMVHDPELKSHAETGNHCCRFTVAIDRDFLNKETGQRDTEFVDCIAWNLTGDFVCKYFQKGDLIALIGRFQCRHFVTKEGEKRKAWELKVDNAYFAEKRARADARQTEQAERARTGDIFSAAPIAELDDDESEIPF